VKTGSPIVSRLTGHNAQGKIVPGYYFAPNTVGNLPPDATVAYVTV